MSLSQLQLASLILREFYGEVTEKVGIYLIKKGNMPKGAIAHDTSIKMDQVKRTLAVLIQQNMAFFEVHKRGFVEYGMDINNVLLRLRFPQYIYTAKMLYGDAAELLIEEMLQHGQKSISRVIEQVTSRLNVGRQDAKVEAAEVRSKFVELVETHFTQRCPDVTNNKVAKHVPSFYVREEDLYSVPAADLDEPPGKRKISSSDEEEPPCKRQKRDETNSAESKTSSIRWRVNYDRFHHYMRDQCIIAAVTRRIDKKAGEIVRTILRISEVKSDPKHPLTTPISTHEISQAIPKELGLSKQAVDQYLSLLTEDSMGFVIKSGDSGGGMFAIHIKKAMTALCTSHIESVIHERFGSKSLRIFKLLLLKKHLEQKQIEEFAMVPAKEAKELLYRMFGEHFISLTEVPRTPDHAPSRTFYLFSVHIDQIARGLLHKCYKAVANLILRREFETKENRRLLDKQQRVEAIAASLEQSGADQTQREEIEEMISPPERAQLAKVKYMTNKLEQSELQLDDTIFILQTYLFYSQIST